MLILLSAHWASAEAETLQQETREVLETTGEGFKNERYLFRRAVHDRIAPRRWFRRVHPVTPSVA
jgi:hypothetical protein